MPREEGGSQGLEKQEKVYPIRFELLTSVMLGVIVTVLLIGSVLWNLYAYEFAELMLGEPVAPPGSLLHALEVQDIEDLADQFRILSLVVIAVASIALLSAVILASTGQMTRAIALSAAGVTLERRGLGPWGRPIVLRTISEMKEVSRGRALKLTGVTAEGRKVTR